jgi:hypothetical protein
MLVIIALTIAKAPQPTRLDQSCFTLGFTTKLLNKFWHRQTRSKLHTVHGHAYLQVTLAADLRLFDKLFRNWRKTLANQEDKLNRSHLNTKQMRSAPIAFYGNQTHRASSPAPPPQAHHFGFAYGFTISARKIIHHGKARSMEPLNHFRADVAAPPTTSSLPIGLDTSKSRRCRDQRSRWLTADLRRDRQALYP